MKSVEVSIIIGLHLGSSLILFHSWLNLVCIFMKIFYHPCVLHMVWLQTKVGVINYGEKL